MIKKKYPSTTPENINPYEAMDFLRDNAELAGSLKACVYVMTEMRKTVKASFDDASNRRKVRSG